MICLFRSALGFRLLAPATLGLLTLISILFFDLPRRVSSQAPAANQKLHRARVSSSPPPVPQCPAATLQTIYAPTIGLREVASGRIVFNSRVDTVADVQPTLYTEEGIAVPGPVIQVQPAEIRYVEIASLIPPTQR